MIVILNYREKEIARRIVVGFKQWICGFDILRVQEGNAVMSFVCDVNGWSFVKNSRYVFFLLGGTKQQRLTFINDGQEVLR